MRIKRLGVLAVTALFCASFVMPAAASPELRGRVLVDYAFHDSDLTELADGHRLRRARLGATGDADENWSYKAEFDFAENSLTVKDAYLRYTGLANGTITLGHFKAPFAMDNLTSSNHVPFIERALPISFAPGRGVGVGYNIGGDNYGFSTMLFGREVGSSDERVDSNEDEGMSLGARFYASPLGTESNILHLGGAFTTGDAATRPGDEVRFSSRPESRVTGVRLVDTEDMVTNVNGLTRLGVEAAYQAGPLTLQSEYLSVKTDGMTGVPSHTFDGYYGQASYVFGGSKRVYRGGTFRAPAVGSWEMALRYSSINLNDGAIEGGEEQNLTLGVNYYPGKNVRFMANYIDVDSERAGVSDDPAILLLRAQVSF